MTGPRWPPGQAESRGRAPGPLDADQRFVTYHSVISRNFNTMNTNNVIPLDPLGANGVGPAGAFAGRRTSLNAAAKADIQGGFAVVGIRGKVWSVKHRGEVDVIKNPDGLPMQRLEVVIVGAAPNLSKQWYQAGYTEGSDNAPDCFSTNGKTPDPSSAKRQSALCSSCPRNVFGSRITENGKRGKECSDRKLLAIVPAGDIMNERYDGPMLLRLPPTSLVLLARYTDMLESKGASLESVVTGLTFGVDAAYPRVEFSVLGWLDEQQALQVVGPDGNSGVCADPKIERMLNTVFDRTAPSEEPSPLDQGGPATSFAPRRVAAPPGTQNPGGAPPGTTDPRARQTPGQDRPRGQAPGASPGGAPLSAEPAPEVRRVPRATPAIVEGDMAVTNDPEPSVREAPGDMLAEIDELLARPA
jgi:hypothetical protein